MKTIDEMTEQEILALTDEQVEKMKKLVLAENGVQFPEKPKHVELFDIEDEDMAVYNIPLLGDMCFANRDEAERVLQLLSECGSLGFIENDYQAQADYFRHEKKRKYCAYNENELSITTKRAYSIELYNKIKDFSKQNKKMQEQLEKDLQAYNKAMERNIELTSGIEDRIREVRSKYRRLDGFKRKFDEEYLPLADGDRDMAIRFMAKAYNLTDEEKEYVLS